MFFFSAELRNCLHKNGPTGQDGVSHLEVLRLDFFYVDGNQLIVLFVCLFSLTLVVVFQCQVSTEIPQNKQSYRSD